jgi:hypothetical protein
MTAQKNFFAGGYANPRNTGGEAPVREPVDPDAPATPDVPAAPTGEDFETRLTDAMTAPIVEGGDEAGAEAPAVTDPDNEGNETEAAPVAIGEFSQTVESFDGPPQA